MGDQDAHSRVIERLRRHAEEVRRLTAGLHEESLSKRTTPEKWSLKELVCHLLRVQRVFDGRLEAMLSQDNPEITSYEPPGDTVFEALAKRPADECLRDFLAERERLVSRLEKMSLEEWHRPGRHPEYSSYDACFQFDMMAHHEAHHMYQMFQRRAPLGRVPHEAGALR